jgi:hypothetical protein
MDIQIKANPNTSLKIFPIALIASAFFISRVIYNLNQEDSGVPFIYSPWVGYIILFIISFFFTVVTFVEIVRSGLIKSALLFIGEKGIDDRLTIFSCGKVAWTEITAVKIVTVQNQDVLIIEVANPQALIRRNSLLKRQVLKKRLKRWNSPIVIPGKRIHYDLEKLKNILLAHNP